MRISLRMRNMQDCPHGSKALTEDRNEWPTKGPRRSMLPPDQRSIASTACPRCSFRPEIARPRDQEDPRQDKTVCTRHKRFRAIAIHMIAAREAAIHARFKNPPAIVSLWFRDGTPWVGDNAPGITRRTDSPSGHGAVLALAMARCSLCLAAWQAASGESQNGQFYQPFSRVNCEPRQTKCRYG